MGDAIKYLYSQFILRDVLSFLTPGAIVVVAATYVFYPELLQRSIHWPLYIPIFGVFYMVGFALQCFGELFGFIRFTPYGERSWRKRFSIFLCNYTHDYDNTNVCQSNIWWWEEERELSNFFERSSDNSGVQLGHERMVVMKQMCANGFFALFIAGIFILVYFYCPYKCVNIALGALLAIVILGSLFWGHRVHMLKQYTREWVFMERR